jgi:exonuclease VII small subunit
MPKRKTPVEKPEDQFERFQKVAKECDVDLKSAEAAFKSLSKTSKNPKISNAK